MPSLWTGCRAGKTTAADACSRRRTRHWRRAATTQESAMAKGLNQKKTEKKKPEKTLKEKRADKANKKAAK